LASNDGFGFLAGIIGLRWRGLRWCGVNSDADSDANPEPNAFTYASSYTYTNSDPNTVAYA